MSVGRAFEDALGAGQDYSELREHHETIPLVPGMTPAQESRAGALWIDQFELTTPARESARPRIEGIKVDRRDRLLLAPASVAERAIRVGTVVALLIATVLGLWWIGGSSWLRSPSPSTPSLPAPTTAVSDAVSPSGKGDRLPIRGIAEFAAPETSPKTFSQAPSIAKVSAPAPAKELQTARLSEENSPARKTLTPVPETRPATIPGWTVREVAGDSAVLEGPHGARRVARGESVPGLGRVETIVRWGNRWIVTTERGLISNN
jgi:hypothetical protein